VRPAGLLHVGLRCTTCHGRPGRPPAGPHARTAHGAVLDRVIINDGKARLRLKLDNRELDIPGLAGGPNAPVAHQVAEHERLACHACHSASNPAAWGLTAYLEKSANYAQWAAIAAQGDPQVLGLLTSNPPLPQSRDWLSGKSAPGVWLAAPFFRRFEWRVYGRGPDGRVMLLAPRFAWLLSKPRDMARLLTTGDGQPALGITPWHSHTTARATVSCADCHGRAMESGLGLTFVKQGKSGEYGGLAPGLLRSSAEGLPLDLDWTRVVDERGRPQAVFLAPGSRPFNRGELARLLRPGKDYTRWLLKALDREWPGSASQAEPGQPQPNGQGGQAKQGGPGPTAPLAQPRQGAPDSQAQSGQNQAGQPGRQPGQ
jgi:hypothetical protein